ncbi:MAG: hypothetical protein ACOH5I_14920 [Oligoflexus sp.]
MASFRRGISLCLLSISLSDPIWAQIDAKALVDRSPEEILRQYMFVGDFSLKEETRENAKEVFWRYPVRLPPIEFMPDFPDPHQKDQFLQAYPATKGAGRAIQHMNRGRTLFLDGDYEGARKTWLGGRARYGQDYDFHCRNDYFIASSFLMLAHHYWRERQLGRENPDVRNNLVNTNTFLSWAYGTKKDIGDAIVDERSPWAYYNQAVIYFLYEKWPAAYGAAMRGLNYLRSSGRSDYRPEFRRLLAELMIRNRSYLEAIQELDLALRQDPSMDLGAQVFARAGDIYFDLNNFELAEDMYALANRLDQSREVIRPSQFILRGEALFWLGRFSESQKMMDYGLRSMAAAEADGSETSHDLQALASLRIADSWLALQENEKAKIAYFRHEQEFRTHSTAQFAKVRLACLELPYYEGQNIRHARTLLGELRVQADLLPPPAQEIAWSCQVASYAQHERTPAMLERVRAFAQRYPRSEFLQSLVPAVREVQARNIEPYFESGDFHSAIDFFEKTRKALFPEISESLRRQLFQAYVDTYQAEKSREFYRPTHVSELGDMPALRRAAMLAEVTSQSAKAPWTMYQDELIKELNQRIWKINSTPAAKLYLDRVLATKSAKLHLAWIFRLAEVWVEKDFTVACNLVHPVLQQILSQSEKSNVQIFQNKAKTFINKYLVDLLRFETQCAYSLLELEQQLYRDNPMDLGQLYLARKELTVNRNTANLFFSIAEINHEAGHGNIAKSLWTHILENGAENLPEVQYAKTRLDNRKTEMEKLWGD